MTVGLQIDLHWFNMTACVVFAQSFVVQISGGLVHNTIIGYVNKL